VQRGERAVFPPGDARDDWSIFRALSEILGHTLPFDSFDALRAAMIAEVPEFGREGLVRFPWAPPSLGNHGPIGSFGLPIKDFYLTNAICRASPTMQRCSQELLHPETFAAAAE
jgi:NADH-quinone oxidoreductase subunit G